MIIFLAMTHRFGVLHQFSSNHCHGTLLWRRYIKILVDLQVRHCKIRRALGIFFAALRITLIRKFLLVVITLSGDTCKVLSLHTGYLCIGIKGLTRCLIYDFLILFVISVLANTCYTTLQFLFYSYFFLT